jgi:hypothetical protein
MALALFKGLFPAFVALTWAAIKFTTIKLSTQEKQDG